MRSSTLLLATMAALTAGCANLTTVHRSLDIGDKDASKAVAIDGYQLPIFSHTMDISGTSTYGVEGKRSAFIVCPNPPVEAITANSLAAAVTNSFKSGQQAAGASNDTQAAISSAMAAASIGLRTNSTTLLSYNATSNCLAYMGGATHDRKFMELARRNQHITLAILAIEQLTGVAQAGQASLNSSSASATGAENLAPLQTALDSAKKDLVAGKVVSMNAAADVNEARETDNAKLADLRSKEAAVKKLKKDKAAEEEIAAATKDLNDAADAMAAARADYQTRLRSEQAAALDLSRLQDSVAHAETALELAERAVRSQTTAAASVGQGNGPRSSASGDIATAVVEIVKTVTKAIGDGETCAAIMDDFVNASEEKMTRWNTEGGKAILLSCAAKEAAAAAERKAAAEKGIPLASAYETPVTGTETKPVATPAESATRQQVGKLPDSNFFGQYVKRTAPKTPAPAADPNR